MVDCAVVDCAVDGLVGFELPMTHHDVEVFVVGVFLCVDHSEVVDLENMFSRSLSGS